MPRSRRSRAASGRSGGKALRSSEGLLRHEEEGVTTNPVVDARSGSIAPQSRAEFRAGKIGFGLRARPLLPFGLVTFFVVVATGVGLYAFLQVGAALDQITDKALPPALA